MAEQLKPLICVLADGSTPSDGSAPLHPTPQPLIIPMRVDLRIPLVFKRADKTIPNITGWTIWLTVRDAITGDLRVARTVPIGDVDGPNGRATVTINRGDTIAGGAAGSLMPGLFDVFALDNAATPLTWRPIDSSAWLPSPSQGDPGGPVTPPAGAVAIIGAPLPLIALDVLRVNAAGTALEWATNSSGGTLASSYQAAASPADNQILASSAKGPVEIRDNATPLGVVFRAANSDGTAPYAEIGADAGFIGASGQLLWQPTVTALIGPNGSLIFLEGTNPSGGNFYQGSVLDNGVMIGHSFNTLVNGALVPVAAAGALLAKFTNNSVSKFVIDKDGKIGPSAANAHTIPAVASDTLALLGAAQTFTNKTFGSNIGLDGDTRDLGDATHRLANLYALGHNSGASTATYTSGIATSGTAVAHSIDATADLVTGDRLLRFKTNSTERGYIEYDKGASRLNVRATATNVGVFDALGNGFFTSANLFAINAGGGATKVVVDTSSVRPNSDLLSSMGVIGGQRWNGIAGGLANVGTAQTVGLQIDNTSPALVGTSQYSPGFALYGRSWETTGGTSQVAGWLMQSQGVNDTAARSELSFHHNSNGALTKIFAATTTLAVGFYELKGAQTTFGVRNNTGTGVTGENSVCYLWSNGARMAFVNGAAFTSNVADTISLGSAGQEWKAAWIGVRSLGAAQTVGLTVNNTTASTVSVTQYSPVSMLLGTSWETTGGTSQVTGWGFQSQGVNAATATSSLALISNSNGTLVTDALIKRSLAAGGDGVKIQSPTGTAFVMASVNSGAQLGYGVGVVQVLGTVIELRSTAPDSASATAVSIGSNFSLITPGGAQVITPTVRNANAQGIMFALVTHQGCHAYGEELTASGTVAAGDIVVWTGTDGKSVATAAATANLTTIAGVAVVGGTAGTVIRVARMGRVRVNCETTVNAAGLLVGTSGATAGRALQGTPGSGALVGRSVCAAGATINTSALGANQVIVDLILG
jgi:hypothetical protein